MLERTTQGLTLGNVLVELFEPRGRPAPEFERNTLIVGGVDCDGDEVALSPSKV